MLHQCSHSSGGGPATPPCSFSILFPMDEPSNHPTPSSYTSVDCTLSLGTPSTRAAPIQRSMSSLCWDLISNSGKHTTRGSSSTADSVGGSSSNMGGDPFLLARRCANCDTTSTPLWRNGPRGPKSLCNACGIRYKKEERRAAASPSPSSSSSSVATGAAAGGYSFQRPPHHPWGCYAPTEFRVMTGNDDEEDYLSWRLNVVPTAQFQVQDLFQYQ